MKIFEENFVSSDEKVSMENLRRKLLSQWRSILENLADVTAWKMSHVRMKMCLFNGNKTSKQLRQLIGCSQLFQQTAEAMYESDNVKMPFVLASERHEPKTNTKSEA